MSRDLSFLLICMLTGSLLLSINIDGREIGFDEIPTVLSAEHILECGVPTTLPCHMGPFSGDDIIDVHPSLSLYDTALGLILFSKRSVAGRFFPMLYALLTIIVFYFFSKELFADSFQAFFSTLLLICNVQFLLYGRFARYYALTGLLATVILFLLYKIFKRYHQSGKKHIPVKQFTLLTLFSIILVYTHLQVAFYVLFAGFGAYLLIQIFSKKCRESFYPLALVSFIVLLALLPQLIYRFSSGSSGSVQFQLGMNFLFSLGITGYYFLLLLIPLPLLLLIGYIYTKHRRRYQTFFLLYIVLVVLAISFMNYNNFPEARKLFPTLLPACLLLLADLFYRIQSWNRPLGIFVVLLYLSSNILFVGPLLAIVPFASSSSLQDVGSDVQSNFFEKSLSFHVYPIDYFLELQKGFETLGEGVYEHMKSGILFSELRLRQPDVFVNYPELTIAQDASQGFTHLLCSEPSLCSQWCDHVQEIPYDDDYWMTSADIIHHKFFNTYAKTAYLFSECDSQGYFASASKEQ